MGQFAKMKLLAKFVFGSPEKDRLKGAIAKTRVDFEQQVQSADKGQAWIIAAEGYLKQSEAYLADLDVQQGWISLQSAKRALLRNPKDLKRLDREAIMLRHEIDKITGWRKKAIEALLESSKIDGSEVDRDHIIEAIELRDDQFNTLYFRISLRQRQLRQLFALIFLSVALCLILTIFNRLPEPFMDWRQVVAVILFGALGAGLSVAQGLLSTDVSKRIPEQQVGAVMVWMRPAIGAAAALVSLALIQASDTFHIFSFKSADHGVVMTIAFAAGYSERFIVGAIGGLSMMGDKKDST